MIFTKALILLTSVEYFHSIEKLIGSPLGLVALPTSTQ